MGLRDGMLGALTSCPPCTLPSPLCPSSAWGKAAGVQKTHAVISNRLQRDSLWIKNLRRCHYSVLPVPNGAGAGSATHLRADVTSRL